MAKPIVAFCLCLFSDVAFGVSGEEDTCRGDLVHEQTHAGSLLQTRRAMPSEEEKLLKVVADGNASEERPLFAHDKNASDANVSLTEGAVQQPVVENYTMQSLPLWYAGTYAGSVPSNGVGGAFKGDMSELAQSMNYSNSSWWPLSANSSENATITTTTTTSSLENVTDDDEIGKSGGVALVASATPCIALFAALVGEFH